MSNGIVKLTVTMKSGAEYEVLGDEYNLIKFHERFIKHTNGLAARTDNYLLLSFGGRIFVAAEIASYSVKKSDGGPYPLKLK